MPNTASPTTRLPDTPASPPKNSGSISEADHTSSPTPRVIMAKVVPDLRVVTQPSRAAKPSPASPPTSGIRLTGRPKWPALARFSVWMVR